MATDDLNSGLTLGDGTSMSAEALGNVAESTNAFDDPAPITSPKPVALSPERRDALIDGAADSLTRKSDADRNRSYFEEARSLHEESQQAFREAQAKGDTQGMERALRHIAISSGRMADEEFRVESDRLGIKRSMSDDQGRRLDGAITEQKKIVDYLDDLVTQGTENPAFIPPGQSLDDWKRNLQAEKKALNQLVVGREAGRQRAAVEDPSFGGETFRGLTTGMLSTATETLGGALRQAGATSGIPALSDIGGDVRSFGKGLRQDTAAQSSGEVLKLGEKGAFFTELKNFVGAKLGEGIGTSVPIIAAAIAAGPAGGVATGMAMGIGQMRNSLEDAFAEEGIDFPEEKAAFYVYTYGSAIGALESAMEVMGVSRVMGAAKQTAMRSMARAIAKGAAQGAVMEGVTEALQELIEIAGVSQATDKPIDWTEARRRMIEGAAAGAVPGTAFGTVSSTAERKGALDAALKRAEALGFREGGEATTAPRSEKDENFRPVSDQGVETVRDVSPSLDPNVDPGRAGGIRVPRAPDPVIDEARAVIDGLAPAQPVAAAPAAPAQIPTFAQVLDVLPKDEAGDPDIGLMMEGLSEFGAKAWGGLTPEQKTTLFRRFAPVVEQAAAEAGPVVEKIAESVASGDIAGAVQQAAEAISQSPYDQYRARRTQLQDAASEASKALQQFPRMPDGRRSDEVKFSPEFRAAKTAYDQAVAQLGALNKQNKEFDKQYQRDYVRERDERRAAIVAAQPQPAPARTDSELRAAFDKMLGTNTKRGQWAETLQIDQAQLDKLVAEGLKDGRLKLTKAGAIRRTGKAKAVETTAPGAATTAAITGQATGQPVAASTMDRATEVRLERTKSKVARRYGQEIAEASNATAVKQAVERLNADPKIKKADLAEIVKVLIGRSAKGKTKAALIAEIEAVAGRRLAKKPAAAVATPAPSAPAPVPAAPAAPAPQAALTVVTPDGSMEVQATPQLVEITDLISASGTLQPRDRTRAEAMAAVREIATRLDPEQLLPARVSDTGAPIVAADGTVISGNGRIMALQEVYYNPALADRADAYRAAIGAGAQGMRAPVLIMRLPASMPRSELERFADLSNRSRIAAMSATERAIRDARAVGPEVMGLYNGGTFTSPANQEFFRSFTARLPASERGAFSRNGVLTKEGEDRMSAAVLASAYGDPDTLSRMLESTDDNIKSITGAMRDAAGAFIRLKASIAAGEASAKFDITPQVADTAKRIADLRDRGISPRMFLDQMDAFTQIDPIVESLLVAFYNDNLSRQLGREKLTEILVRYAEEAAKHKGDGLFEDTTSPRDIVTVARGRALESERLAAGQGNLFDRSPSPAGGDTAGGRGTGPGPANDGRGRDAGGQAAAAGGLTDAPSRDPGLERDWRDGPPQDGLGQADVPASGGPDAGGAGQGDAASATDGQADGGGSLLDGDAAPVGERGDSAVQGGAPGVDGSPAGGRGRERGGAAGVEGLPPDRVRPEALREAAANTARVTSDAEKQRAADDTIPFVANDLENIRESLPLLNAANQADVAKAEARFSQPDKFGFLFTNGTGTGKAQPLDAGLLTPTGWRRMGDISVGDKVMSADGTATTVTGVYPQGSKSIFRVVLSDGTSTECCDDHLWETQTLYERRKASENPMWDCARPKVRSLSEIRQTLHKRHFLPISKPIQYAATQPLPIDGYVLGVLIGDGNFTHTAVSFSTMDSEMVERVRERLPFGTMLKEITTEGRCPAWRISNSVNRVRVNGQYERGIVQDRLSSLGLMGLSSRDKFIPDAYQRAPVEDRIALLQGLLDTDGYGEKRSNSIYFTTIAATLAHDVIELVQGLGGVATMSSRVPNYSHNGERRVGQRAYTLSIRLPNEIQPFTLKRKKLPNRSWGLPKRAIVDIQYVGEKEAQCIAVDHPRHLYVTDNHILTHNTFLGLGVIKRFEKQGKGNVLILAPSQGILDGWIKSGQMMNIDVTRLDDTKSAGEGVVATTYANLRDNSELVKRRWDLIIADEAHSLSQNQSGNPSDALQAFRGLTNHSPATRARLMLAPMWAEIERVEAGNKAFDTDQFGNVREMKDEYFRRLNELTDQYKAEPRTTRALFLSATPFAYRKSTDWAEGFLFDYPADSNRYGTPGGRDAFLVQNFGYNFRYNRAEEPGPEVNTAVLEREFYERMKREGALSGRRLEVDADYDRRFVLVDDAVGSKIDQAMDWLSTQDGGRYRPLYELFMQQFNYLSQRRLLEAIKAQHVIPRIRRDLDLGRKVVVFHDYNEGGGLNPFEAPPNPNERARVAYGEKAPTLGELYYEFIRANPYVKTLNFAQFDNPIETLTKAFGKRAAVYNGRVPNKQRAKARDEFNRDGSGLDVIIVQSAAGEAGISLHDTTGKHQRILYNLGLPTRPTTAIQQEGRIYREGQVSDAILRYMSTGTGWERRAFAQTIAERASTAENLALGEEARALRDGFIDAFNEADAIEQGPDEGKGSKARDRSRGSQVTPFERAKAFYFGQLRTKGRRDQREGVDYYATPEPIGFKMVEFADIRLGEKVLEPSAGHGAIARWFPEGANRVLIEPSSTLASRAGLSSPGANVIQGMFEDHYIGNKYDAIVMNPPFGSGGKDAFEHLQKAVGHLRSGGRIVAIVPRGGMADRRYETFRDADSNKNVYVALDVELPRVMFERAGTSVATRMIVLEKHDTPDTAPNPLYRDLSDAETITELFNRIEGLSLSERRRGGQERAPTTPVASPTPVAATPASQTVPAPTPNLTASAEALGAEAFRRGALAVPAQDRALMDLIRGVQGTMGSSLPILNAWTKGWFAAQAASGTSTVAASAPPTPQAAPAAPGLKVSFKLAETVHGKTGEDLFVASIATFVPRETYEKLRTIAKRHGGYYSTFRGRGAIPGFQFSDEDARAAFLQEVAGPKEAEAPPARQAAPVIEEDGKALQDIVNPIDPNASPDEKLQQIAALTAVNKPLLDAQLKAMDAALGTTSNANIKKPETILSKASRPSILAEKPWHGVEHIRDTLRFQTKISRFEQIEQAAEAMLSQGYSIVKIDTKKMLAPKEWGWRFAVFDLRAPNGQLIEWYIIFDTMYVAKKEGHLIFEKWRNETAEAKQERAQEYEADIEKSYALYKRAFETGLQNSGYSDLEAASADISKLSASLPVTAAKFAAMSSGLGSGVAMPSLTGTQSSSVPGLNSPPTGSPITQALPEPSSAASTKGSLSGIGFPSSSNPNYIGSSPGQNNPGATEGRVTPAIPDSEAQRAVDAFVERKGGPLSALGSSTPETPDRAWAAVTESTSRKNASVALKNGLSYKTPTAVAAGMRQALKQVPDFLPESTDVGFITRIKHGKNFKLTAEVEVADGSTIQVRDLTIDHVIGSRALYLRLGDRNLVVHIRYAAPGENGVASLTAERWHEGIHALYADGLFDDATWRLLVGHAESLGILQMKWNSYLDAIQDAGARGGNETLAELYIKAYRDRVSDAQLRDYLEQEAVAIMTELMVRGVDLPLPEDIRRIYAMIETGEAARGGFVGQAETRSDADRGVAYSLSARPDVGLSPEARTAPLDRDAYISAAEYRNSISSNYFDGETKKASSREVPVTTPLPPVGTWRIDRMKSNHGYEIEKLVKVPIDQLDTPEIQDGQLDPTKRGDDERYAGWLASGMRPPPIEVLERDDGTLRVMDGHRRVLAAKRLGQTEIEAWVSYAAPIGVTDSNGRPIKAALTLEIAQKLLNPSALFSLATIERRSLARHFGATRIEDIGPNDPHPGRVLAFHGTGGAFDRLDPEKTSFGVHFGTGDQANYVIDAVDNRAPRRVYPAVIDARNPVTLPDIGTWGEHQVALELQDIDPVRFGGLGDLVLKIWKDGNNSDYASDLAKETVRIAMEDAGYDAIRYYNRFEGEGWSYIVWEPGKVISATAGTPLFALSGGLPRDLDMSPEARKQRAEEMGFDTSRVWYHVTDRSFDKFSLRPKSRNTDTEALAVARAGIWMSNRPERVAERTGMSTDGGRTLPLYVRGDLYRAGTLSDVFELVKQKGWKARLRDDGYSGLIIDDEEFSRGYADIDREADAAYRAARQKEADLQKQANASWPPTPELRSKWMEAIAEAEAAAAEIAKLKDERNTKSVVIFDPSNIRSVNASFDPAQSDSSNLMFALSGGLPRDGEVAGARQPTPDEMRRTRASGENAYLLSPASVMETDPYHAFPDMAASLPDSVNAEFMVHGLYATQGAGLDADLIELLEKGIDKSRPWHAGPPKGGVSGIDSTRSNAPYLILSDRGGRFDSAIKYVVLNGPAAALKFKLSVAYPGVDFLTVTEADQFMRTGALPPKSTMQVGARQPTPPGIAKTAETEADEGGASPSLNAVIQKLKESLGVIPTQTLLGVTIKAEDGSQVRLNPKKNVRGQMTASNAAVGVRKSRQLDVIAHEMAHTLEVTLGADILDFQQQNAAMLEAFAPGSTPSEQFADWFSYYITSGPGARAITPSLVGAFEDVIEANAPEMLEGIHEAQDLYADWLKRSTPDELASDVVSTYAGNSWTDLAGGDRSLSETIPGKMAGAYTAVIDDLSPVQHMVRRLLKTADQNGVVDEAGRPISLAVADNPYKIARMFRGSYATGYSWLKSGIANRGETSVAFPGLSKALETLFGSSDQGAWDQTMYQTAGNYLIAKRAVAEYERMEEKEARLADIDSLIERGGAAGSQARSERGRLQAILERREDARLRSEALMRDRRTALQRAEREVARLQERIQAKKDDVLAAQMARDGALASRRQRDLANLERSSQAALRAASGLLEEFETLSTDVSLLSAEIAQRSEQIGAMDQQIAQIDGAVGNLRRERDATAKRGASRPPTKESKQHWLEVIAKTEADPKYARIQPFADEVHQFAHGLLTIRHQAGLVSDEQFQELSKRRNWYVPFQRDMSDASPETVFGGAATKKWSPFKKFDGSDRAIINPLETLASDAYATAQQIAFNDAVNALAGLAERAGPGSASIAQVLTREESAEANETTFKRIKDIALGMGLEEADADRIVHQMEQNFAGQELSLMWSPATKGPVNLPTVPLWRNGERVLVRLTDPEFGTEAFNALSGLGKEMSDWAINFLAVPARLLQMGITTHPTFLPRNLFRDIFDAWIKTGALPVVTQVKGARAMRDPEFLRRYYEAGGIVGGRNVAALTSKEQQYKVLDLSDNRISRGSIMLGAVGGGLLGTLYGGPIGGVIGAAVGGYALRKGEVLKAVEAVETMTRVGVASHAYKRALEHNPDLTESEAMLEAAFVARDTFDWNRRGSKMLTLTRLVTFLNAQIQGMDAAARKLGGESDRGMMLSKHLGMVWRRENGGVLSADEERMLGEAYKTWARMGLYTAGLMALYALATSGDDEDDKKYQDIRDKTKATHSWLPNIFGVDVRLPKAFEWALPANVIEAIADKVRGRDPRMWDRIVDSTYEVMAPPLVPQAMTLIVGLSTNAQMEQLAPWLKRLLGRDQENVPSRQVVAENLARLDPESQFDAFTSQLSIDIAKGMAASGVPRDLVPSPKKIDFILRSGGYWGQDIAKGYGIVREGLGFRGREAPRVSDIPVVAGFTGVAARQSKSRDELFGLMAQSGGRLATAAATYKQLIDEEGTPADAERFISRLDPDERAYALLKYHAPAAVVRNHPLERLLSVDRVLSRIRKDAILDRLTPINKIGDKNVRDFEEKITLSPRKQTEIHEIIERLQQAESWNTMILMNRPGWEQKKEIPVKPILDELKASDKRVHDLFEDRLQSARAREFSDVKQDWPDLRNRILTEGVNAF